MWRLIEADCVEAMREMPEASVDAVVTDPPYGINFMGKAWDGKAIAQASKNAGGDHHKSRERSASMHAGSYDLSLSGNQHFQAWCELWAAEALRILKPGGHLLAFGGSRTYHRLACAVEDAGFEVRDQMMWLYGSGFPKSLNVGKAIDKAAGEDGRTGVIRMAQGRARRTADGRSARMATPAGADPAEFVDTPIYGYAPVTDGAKRWEGWGTALKPAHEPIVVARKPLAGTVAANVLEFGTGALNIDGCRIGIAPGDEPSAGHRTATFGTQETVSGGDGSGGWTAASGRWPANVMMDEEAGRLLDEQSGERAPGAAPKSNNVGFGSVYTAGGERAGVQREARIEYDSGGASRFFYCAKSSKAERNAGLDGFEVKRPDNRTETGMRTFEQKGVQPQRNAHPTVKPIELMRYLCRLVTPPGGTVLDPFTGSGTTGCAAVLEGFEFVGVEREAEYAQIAKARIAWWEKHQAQGDTDDIMRAAGVRDEVKQSGQLGLLDEAA